MRNKNHFIERVIKGAQWAKVAQRNCTQCVTTFFEKVYTLILLVVLTIHTWTIVHKKDIAYTLRKLLVMMVTCFINAILITSVYQMGISIFPNDFIKEVINGKVVYFTLEDIKRTQSIEYWFLFFPIMAAFSIAISYLECRRKKIGNYSYNKKLNKRKFVYEVITAFAKISTLETIFRLFIDTIFLGTFNNFLVNVLYLIVLFVGLYIIYAIKNFLFGEGEKGKHELTYKAISGFFVGYFGAILSFMITFHKVHKNFSFIISDNFAFFVLILVVYFVFYNLIGYVINKYEFTIKRVMKNKKVDIEMIKQMKKEMKRNIITKVIVNNLYYFLISFWPTWLGLDAAFLWFFNNPIVAVVYFLVLVIKATCEVKFELLEFRKKFEK
jgi:hypothetical protein